MHKIVLKGCRPEPLSNYLKALGVLRVLSESRSYAKCKGYWENDNFVLITTLTEAEIREFFLREYAPSPFVSPWNGSTGFYAKDAQKGLLQSILDAPETRFGEYHKAIKISQSVVERLKLKEQPKDAQLKKQLLSQLRDAVPDTMAKWIDTCAMITNDADSPLKFVPLMGTGGNDGNFEFGRTFMQQLQNLIDFATGEPIEGADKLLRSALFDEVLPKLAYSGKIGQFSPIAAGGANATTGTDGDSRVNPWDFVLMLEGMLVFMPGITRRGEVGKTGVAAPFTASRPSLAGYGSAADEKVRAELWIPLWDRPVGLGELGVLFREGRAKVNTIGKLKYRTAKSGVDFVRAVSSLGVARGIGAFHRYAFLERNGLSYFAVSLGRYVTPSRPRRDPLRDLDGWLQRFAVVAADGGDAPAAVKRSRRLLEHTIVAQAQGKAGFLDLLIALGEAEKALNQSLGYLYDPKMKSFKVNPIPYLRSSRWLIEANDNSPEFRLALALARSGLRQRLVRVRGQMAYWEKDDDKITTWGLGSLEDNLLMLMQRIEIEQEQSEKLSRIVVPVEEDDDDENDSKQPEQAKDTSKPQVDRSLRFLPKFEDIEAWIRDGTIDDDRLEAIVRGLSLLKFTRATAQVESEGMSEAKLTLLEEDGLVDPIEAKDTKEKATKRKKNQLLRDAKCLPVDYQLLKLAQHRQVKPDKRLPRVPGLINKLRGDRIQEALADAARRLRSSSLRPRIDPRDVGDWVDPDLTSARLGAALAFPITDEQVATLLEKVCISENTDN